MLSFIPKKFDNYPVKLSYLRVPPYIFIKTVPVYPKGTEVALSNGETGLVVSNTSNPLRPIVKMYDTKEEINLNTDMDYMNVIIAPHTIVECDYSQ